MANQTKVKMVVYGDVKVTPKSGNLEVEAKKSS